MESLFFFFHYFYFLFYPTCVVQYFYFPFYPTCVFQLLSCVWLFATLWTVACQAPLFMEFLRQEYWGGLPSSPSGDLPDQGSNPSSCISCMGRQILYRLNHLGSPRFIQNHRKQEWFFCLNWTPSTSILFCLYFLWCSSESIPNSIPKKGAYIQRENTN